MDIRISAFYETLINDLRSLNKLNLNFSKKESTFINQYIEKIEKVAILRYKLAEINTSHLEKEIAYLDNIEDKFIGNLQYILIYSEISNLYPAQSDSLERFFAGFTSFVALTAYLATYIALSAMLLSASPPLLACVLLTFFTISAFSIFQVNIIKFVENKSPVSSYLKETLSSLKNNLKNTALKLEQSTSLLEDKINYLENKNLDFALPYGNERCLTPPSSPVQTLSPLNINNFFKPSSENNNNILANIQTTKSYQPD